MWNFIFKNWNEFSIKKQLVIKFVWLTCISFIVTICVIISFDSILNNSMSSTVQNHLTMQLKQDLFNVNSDAVNLIHRKFDAPTKNSALLHRFNLESTFRTDYPYVIPVPFHYEWQYDMAPPVQFYTRYNSYLSLQDGGVNVGQYNPSIGLSYTAQTYNPSALLPISVNHTASQCQSVFPTSKAVYFQEGGPLVGTIISIYSCFQAHGELCEYPGASNGNVSQLAQYDCRNDDWYMQGLNCLSSTACYTYPYVDPWVKEVEFSIVLPFRNRMTGQIMGVVGNDLITDSIESSIRNVVYLQNGRAILFYSTGIVMSDSERPVNQPYSKFTTYQNIQGIHISDTQWNSMVSQLNNFIDLGDYYAQAQFLPTGTGKQYILVIFSLKSDVFAPLQPIQQHINANNATTTWIIAVILVVVFICVIIVMYCLILQVAHSIQHLTDISNKLVQNIGNQNLAEGVDEKEGEERNRFVDIDETKELNNALSKLILKIKEDAAQSQTSTYPKNIFYDELANKNTDNDNSISKKEGNVRNSIYINVEPGEC